MFHVKHRGASGAEGERMKKVYLPLDDISAAVLVQALLSSIEGMREMSKTTTGAKAKAITLAMLSATKMVRFVYNEYPTIKEAMEE